MKIYWLLASEPFVLRRARKSRHRGDEGHGIYVARSGMLRGRAIARKWLTAIFPPGQYSITPE